jgi:hypothetical protein
MSDENKQVPPGGFAGATGSAIPAGHPEELCDDCGGPNVVWFAPSPIWNSVVRQPDKGDPMLCPRCFILRCERMGIRSVWKVIPESPND